MISFVQGEDCSKHHCILAATALVVATVFRWMIWPTARITLAWDLVTDFEMIIYIYLLIIYDDSCCQFSNFQLFDEKCYPKLQQGAFSINSSTFNLDLVGN